MDKDFKHDYNRADLNMYLSDKELNELKGLNKISNTLRNDIHVKKDPIHMNIKELFQKWASVNIHIIIDITNFFSNINSYYLYFDDIDETGQWYEGLYKLYRNFLNIFIKDDRSIYVGMTLLFLSFAIYIIQITS